MEFKIGNVIRPPGDTELWVVTNVTDDLIHAVPFNYANCSAIQRLNDHEREETCGSCAEWPNPECEACHGTFSVTRQIVGWKHSTLVAPTIKQFLLDGVKRMFNL